MGLAVGYLERCYIGDYSIGGVSGRGVYYRVPDDTPYYPAPHVWQPAVWVPEYMRGFGEGDQFSNLVRVPCVPTLTLMTLPEVMRCC